MKKSRTPSSTYKPLTPIQMNTDNNLQSRWVVNINPFKITLKPNTLFNDYLKSRLKKPIEEQTLEAYSYVKLEHGYFTPEADCGFRLRECFDEQDLNETLEIFKGDI